MPPHSINVERSYATERRNPAKRISATSGHRLVSALIKGDRYCTWTIRRIAKAIGREHSLAGADWDALQALNGVEWVAMGDELATAVRTKSAEMLRLPPEAFATPEAVKITRGLVDRLLGRGR